MAVKPLGVLIVDDEIPLRQELRIFPWEACGAEWIGEASNGSEALELCADCVPDVVITDITMPVMDGIALTRELRKRYPNVQIILLTCHSDFHYVQEALRLGALEYILKVSMEEEELKQAMVKVRAAIAKERLAQDHAKREQRQSQAVLFGKLLHGQMPGSSDWHSIALSEDRPVLLVRVLLDIPHPAYLHVKEPIQKWLNERESSDPGWLSWLTVRDREYFMLINCERPSEDVLQSLGMAMQDLTELMNRESTMLERSATAYAHASEAVTSKEGLASALAYSNEWRDALFYDRSPEESRVFAGQASPLTDMSEKKAKEISELLRKASSRSVASLKECLRGEFMDWCLAERIKPGQLMERMLNWQVEWLKEQEGAELGGVSIALLMESGTLSQMVACMIRDIAAVELGRSRSRFEIRLAVQWIKDHLKEPLSLPVIAEQVGLSPHHISKLFREETGSTVNQYITRLRMEKAIELLRHSNKKVYEVAEEVGIPSYRYFTVTFRNWTGVSPTDYKRNS
ncbi:response regulator transcription factor [Paenibacillus harenae]|uniref:Two-component system response regulator YesN n=1 Tax=Paenibacillus harenae TaxID=306543 RepID=A0ABT9TZ46_PAEHA|nr:response regulator [Paenibacillus harenae]MDQ0112652.1 two-component system response regulator YesN [Paenibacillus harenae]